MSVYFIRAGADGPFVKIGHAEDPQARMRCLDTASPFPLVLMRVIDGGEEVERWLHRHFSALRVKGEWFRFTAAMLDIEPPHIVARSRRAPLLRAIEALGSSANLARSIGVTPQAVHAWDRIPAERVLPIERATEGKVTRHELRPDLYPEEDVQPAPQTAAE